MGSLGLPSLVNDVEACGSPFLHHIASCARFQWTFLSINPSFVMFEVAVSTKSKLGGTATWFAASATNDNGRNGHKTEDCRWHART